MRILVSVLIFINSFSLFGQVPSYVPTDSLKAWYPFNGDSNDETSNNNNGVVNGAVLSLDRFGKADSSYFFDGTNDYIDLTNDFDFPNRTICLWVNASSINPLLGSIYDSDHAAINNGHTKMFVIENTGVDGIVLGAGLSNYNSDFNVGEWKMLTIARDTVETTFYINDSLVGSVPTGNSNSGTGHDKALLGCTRLFDRFFHGNIDDVGIWNRKLTPCEIQDLYYAVQGFNSTTVSLGVQSIIADQSSDAYQWLYCDSSFAEITGETSQSYSPAIDGNYSVEITLGACVDTSTCLFVGLQSVIENQLPKIELYPNPTNGLLFTNKSSFDLVKIYSVDGKLVGMINTQTIDLSNYRNGGYIIEFYMNKELKYQPQIIYKK